MHYPKLFFRFIGLLLLTNCLISAHGQVIARMEVSTRNSLALPVQVSLDALTFLPDSLLQLVEVSEKTKVPVPFQIGWSSQRTLHWIIGPGPDQPKRTYELIRGQAQASPAGVRTVVTNGHLTITTGNQNLLRYHHGTVYPPAGIDTVYRRSGFIHPLWSPRGQELTRVNAPDHYHHWGLWNPWTHVLFQGDTVDFWNLDKKQGTVRFARPPAVHIRSAQQ